MHRTTSLCLLAALALSSAANGWEPPLPDAPRAARSASLFASHGPHFAPVIHTPDSSDLVLNGFILVATGLVAGAGGFAIMAACPQNSACYSDTLNTVAWVLAAPGIIPLVVGACMIYLGTPNGRADLFAPPPTRRWAFTFLPLPGGGAVGARAGF